MARNVHARRTGFGHILPDYRIVADLVVLGEMVGFHIQVH